jgi:glycerol dehydrogenase-like iron-containing ADH family enzyme
MSTTLDVFPLTIENGAATERLRERGANAIVCTMAEPWALVADLVPAPEHRIEALSVELADLRAIAEAVPTGADVVIGMGGGTAIDTAKYVAEATGLPLIQIPTIISVDAAFTAPYGYRDGSRVRYAGNLRPVEVICDPDLIRRAPAALNRAGVGDLLSCHTGMHDWRLAVDGGRGDIAWNEDAAALGRRVLDEMEVAAPEIHAVSEAGIRWLAEIHRDVGAGCVTYGARFEEGSEHFLAYTFEWLTNEHRVHGELISCCALAMSFVQDNEPDRVVELVRRTGVDARPSHLGISPQLFSRMCAELPAYAEREALWPSVIETVEWNDDLATRTFAHVRQATGD